MGKISIRFYKDHEVRAVWDEEYSKWWFSVLDIVGAINEQIDYKKNRIILQPEHLQCYGSAIR